MERRSRGMRACFDAYQDQPRAGSTFVRLQRPATAKGGGLDPFLRSRHATVDHEADKSCEHHKSQQHKQCLQNLGSRVIGAHHTQVGAQVVVGNALGAKWPGVTFVALFGVTATGAPAGHGTPTCIGRRRTSPPEAGTQRQVCYRHRPDVAVKLARALSDDAIIRVESRSRKAALHVGCASAGGDGVIRALETFGWRYAAIVRVVCVQSTWNAVNSAWMVKQPRVRSSQHAADATPALNLTLP